MVPDYKPNIPEWFHQQYELERFLAESRARVAAQEKTANKRRWRFLVGSVICWLATAAFLILTERVPVPHNKEPLVPSEPPVSFISTAAVPILPSAVKYIEAQNFRLPLLPEPDSMKQVLHQLGAIEVQGSLYTTSGKSYQGPLWVRKVMRGEEIYLDEAELYEIDGPFRFRLPANSTVYVYAPVPGLAWNGGWGVPIQMPSSFKCSQPGSCALRLEELMYAAIPG